MVITSSCVRSKTSGGTLSSSNSLRSRLPELCARLSFTMSLLSPLPAAALHASLGPLLCTAKQSRPAGQCCCLGCTRLDWHALLGCISTASSRATGSKFGGSTGIGPAAKDVCMMGVNELSHWASWV